MRRIPAVGPGQQLGGGSQRRTWARADNGTYQVKLPEPGTNWVLFNELLGVTLATVAGLHPAPSALVELADAPSAFSSADRTADCYQRVVGSSPTPGATFTRKNRLFSDFSFSRSARFAQSLPT